MELYIANCLESCLDSDIMCNFFVSNFAYPSLLILNNKRAVQEKIL